MCESRVPSAILLRSVLYNNGGFGFISHPSNSYTALGFSEPFMEVLLNVDLVMDRTGK